MQAYQKIFPSLNIIVHGRLGFLRIRLHFYVVIAIATGRNLDSKYANVSKLWQSARIGLHT